MPHVDLREVFRRFFLQQLGDRAEDSQRAFSKRTLIKRPDVNTVVKGKRKVSVGQVQRITVSDFKSTSLALLALAEVAWQMEKERVAPLDSRLAARSLADPEFQRAASPRINEESASTDDAARADDDASRRGPR